jgi:hypothetical protein
MRVNPMSNSRELIAEHEAELKTPPSTGSERGELLRRELRCSACGGVLPAGIPISTLLWDRESRRFRHSPSCMAQGRSGHETERFPSAEPTSPSESTASPSVQHPKDATSPPPRPTASAHEGSGEPGPEAGRDWARIGFTLRLAEYESLRAEVALYSVLDEADAKFTERLRESLLLKVQEALAAIEETREMVRGGART